MLSQDTSNLLKNTNFQLNSSLMAIIGRYLFGGDNLSDKKINVILISAFINTYFPPKINIDLLLECISYLIHIKDNYDYGIIFQDEKHKLNDAFLGIPLSSYLNRICKYANLQTSVHIITNYKKTFHKLTCEEYCELNEIGCDDGYYTDHFFGCVRDHADKEELNKLVNYDDIRS